MNDHIIKTEYAAVRHDDNLFAFMFVFDINLNYFNSLFAICIWL